MIVNKYEDIAKLEHDEKLLKSLKPFEYGVGNIPPFNSYTKLSVDSEEEAMTLAKIGAVMADKVVPGQKLYFSQALLIGAIVSKNPKYRSIMMICCTRYGKLIHYDTPVITPFGWIKHGELKVGDYVFHPSGKPIRVIAKSPNMNCDARVHFQNGEVIDCHMNHEWTVYDSTYDRYYTLETRQILNLGIDRFSVCAGRVPYKNNGIWKIEIIEEHRIGITKIEKIEDGGIGNCIQVDSPDGLYCVGKTCLPTHNSYLTGLSAIASAAVLHKEVRIGGATRDKADIVMEKIINFMPNTSLEIQNGMQIGDSEATVNKKIARLSTQTSREALSWKTGGSIKMFTMSETSKNADVAGAGAIGVGGDIQIYDECLDGDTEILTEIGFIKFKDLPDGLKVAQYHLSGQVEFVLPNKVIRQPAVKRQAYAVRFSSLKKPVIMTTNHRQPLLWKNEQTPRIQEINNVSFSGKKQLIQAGLNTRTKYEPLTADERVDIAIQADGRKLKEGYWQVSLKKKRKIKRLKALLEKSSYRYTSPDHPDKQGFTNFFIYSDKASKLFNKMFSVEMHCDRAREFAQEILHWDGHITEKQSSNTFGTTEKENADFVAAVCAQCGIATFSSTEEDNRKETYKDYHRVLMRDAMTRGVTNATKELIDFDEPTYCVSVPSTMFVARKDGLTFITGNTELISNSNYYTARRFLIESSDTKLVELGNPLTLGHFKDIYDDKSTFVLHMNDITTIFEGRMRREDFDLARIPKHTQQYKSFIQCEFPSEEQGDGFFSTMPKSFYDLPSGRVCQRKISFMGIDSAYKGADGLVVTIISLCQSDKETWVEVEYQEDLKARHPVWRSETTMQIALDILTLANKYHVASACIDIAFGIHVYEMIKQIEPDFNIEPVNFGNKPTESRKEIYYSATWAYNLRAEMHLDVKELCENGFLYIDNNYFDGLIREMREIRVENELGKIKIEGKKKIKSRLGASPDRLDSLCLATRAMIMSGTMGGSLDDGEGIAFIEE